MTQPTRPPYIERGGEQSWPPPYDIRGVRFYAFILEADYATLETYVDRVLNDPAGGAVRYKPLAGRVLLGLMGAEKVLVGPLGAAHFSIPERDLAFWIPVACVERRLGIDVITRIAFYLSYVQVDDGWAVISGREELWLSEGAGPVRRGDDRRRRARAAGGSSVRLESHTLAVARFGPDAAGLVSEAHRDPPRTRCPAEPRHEGARSLEELASEFYGTLVGGGRLTLPGWGLAAEVADLITHHRYPLVFLKQFRDIADGTRACYRSVVESPVHITAFRAAGLLDGRYEIAIGTYESHPIVQDLGLVSTAPPVLAAGYMDFDFYVDKGVEIGPA